MSEHNLITLDEVARRAAAGHSAFSPSSSKMWLNCSGSLIPNILAEDECSYEAAEGTVAHKVGEQWLKTGKRPKSWIGRVFNVEGWDIEVTEEMLAYVSDYVDYVQELELRAVEFLTETRVDFSDLTPIPDQGGTADHIAIVPGPVDFFEIVVTDLKYGKGVRVYAEGNTQCRIYAYGAWKLFKDKYDISTVTIRIAHPRLTDGFTEQSISIEELLEFADFVKDRAAAAWHFDAPRTPTEEGCQWCKIRGTCPALYEYLADATAGVFEDDDDDEHSYTGDQQRKANEDLEDELGPEPFKPVNPARLSTAALAKLLRYRGLMEKFFNEVESELLERAISREEEIPGWKLVRGRSTRSWPDNIVPIYKKLKALGINPDALWKTDFISPAQAEALLHAKAGLSKDEASKVVNAVAVKPLGKKSLVRASDKREALPSDGDVFADDED